jgi:hypothetical protein
VFGELSTLEIRWFLRGPIPDSVSDWFLALGSEPGTLSPRVDHYLRTPGKPGLGIKLREGGLEVKVREAEEGLVRLRGGMVGLLERWTKWRFDILLAPTTEGRVSGPDTRWTAVEKRRTVRRYTTTADGQVVEVACGTIPTAGCATELASVSVSGSTWWTLAFEAHGEEWRLRSEFEAVTQHCLSGSAPPELSEPASRGYPAFLCGEVWGG